MDLYIPFAEKDVACLPLCIAGARRFLFPEPTRIVCVGQLTGDVKAVVDAAGGEFLDEDKVISGFSFANMRRIKYGPMDRTGWYFQQLLKYGFRERCQDAYYMVLDADMVLVSSYHVVTEDRYILRRDSQHHMPYFLTFQRLFGYPAQDQASFIADGMVFDTMMLGEMLNEIECRSKVPWPEAIMEVVGDWDVSTFSEYETYGNWLSLKYPNRFVSEDKRSAWMPNSEIVRHEYHAEHARTHGFKAICYHNRPGCNISLAVMPGNGGVIHGT